MLDEEYQYGIQNHDHKTYELLIGEYSKLLWVVASGVLKNVGSIEDIEDCVAESFAYLWEKPHKYDQNKGSIKSYLCLITRNKAIDKIRKINRIRTIEYDNNLKLESDDVEKMLINKEMIKEIYYFTKSLKALEAEIFILRYFYQLKPREIADKLQITVKEVSNRLYYSKKSLLAQMKG